MTRYIYVSKTGGKPMNIGMNQAKRVARSADKRDQLAVLKTLGPGLPRQHEHHQQLVASRHHYYHEQHEESSRTPSAVEPAREQGARERARRVRQMEAARGRAQPA